MPVEESVARCVERDGKSEEAVRKIISAQVSGSLPQYDTILGQNVNKFRMIVS